MVSQLSNAIKSQVHGLDLEDCKNILIAFRDSHDLSILQSLNELAQALVISYFQDVEQLVSDFESMAQRLSVFLREFEFLRLELLPVFQNMIALFKNKPELQLKLQIILNLFKAAQHLKVQQYHQTIINTLNSSHMKQNYSSKDALSFMMQIDGAICQKYISQSFIGKATDALDSQFIQGLDFTSQIKLLQFITGFKLQSKVDKQLQNLIQRILISLSKQTRFFFGDAYCLLRASSTLPVKIKKQIIDGFVQSVTKNVKMTDLRNYLRIIQIFATDETYRKNKYFKYQIFSLTPFQTSTILKSLGHEDLPILASIIKHEPYIEYPVGEIIRLLLRCDQSQLTSHIRYINTITKSLPRQFNRTCVVSPFEIIQLISKVRGIQQFQDLPYLVYLLAQIAKRISIHQNSDFYEEECKFNFNNQELIQICYQLGSHCQYLKPISFAQNLQSKFKNTFGLLRVQDIQQLEEKLIGIHQVMQFYDEKQEIQTRSKIISALSMFNIYDGLSNLEYLLQQFKALLKMEIKKYDPITIPSLIQVMFALRYFDRELVVAKSKQFYVSHSPAQIQEYKRNLKQLLAFSELLSEDEKCSELCIAALRAKKEKLS